MARIKLSDVRKECEEGTVAIVANKEMEDLLIKVDFPFISDSAFMDKYKENAGSDTGEEFWKEVPPLDDYTNKTIILIDELFLDSFNQLLPFKIISEPIKFGKSLWILPVKFNKNISTLKYSCEIKSPNSHGPGIGSFSLNTINKLVYSTLIPTYKRDVAVYYSRMSYHNLHTKNRDYPKFYVIIAGGIRPTHTSITPERTPSKFREWKLSWSGSSFPYIGISEQVGLETIPIYDEATGWVAAYIVNRNHLFITFDALHDNTDENSYKILEFIFMKAAEYACLTEEEAKHITEEYSIMSFGSIVKRSMENRIVSLQNDISTSLDKIDSAQRQILEYSNKLMISMELKNALSNKINEQNYSQEYLEILKISHVESLCCDESTISVKTNDIYVRDPRDGEVFHLGKFLITINVNHGDRRTRPISWKNLTQRIDAFEESMHAPHVFRAGNACLGNAEPMITDAITKRNVYEMVMVAVEFIKSVNVDDPAGRLVRRWPHVNKDEVPESANLEPWDESQKREIPESDYGPWDYEQENQQADFTNDAVTTNVVEVTPDQENEHSDEEVPF